MKKIAPLYLAALMLGMAFGQSPTASQDTTQGKTASKKTDRKSSAKKSASKTAQQKKVPFGKKGPKCGDGNELHKILDCSPER